MEGRSAQRTGEQRGQGRRCFLLAKVGRGWGRQERLQGGSSSDTGLRVGIRGRRQCRGNERWRECSSRYTEGLGKVVSEEGQVPLAKAHSLPLVREIVLTKDQACSKKTFDADSQ